VAWFKDLAECSFDPRVRAIVDAHRKKHSISGRVIVEHAEPDSSASPIGLPHTRSGTPQTPTDRGCVSPLRRYVHCCPVRSKKDGADCAGFGARGGCSWPALASRFRRSAKNTNTSYCRRRQCQHSTSTCHIRQRLPDEFDNPLTKTKTSTDEVCWYITKKKKRPPKTISATGNPALRCQRVHAGGFGRSQIVGLNKELSASCQCAASSWRRVRQEAPGGCRVPCSAS